MTSKTFTSAWPNNPRRINVREIEDGVNIRISDPQWEYKKGITIAPSDAPELALAILEAAGVEAKNGVSFYGTPEHLRVIAFELSEYDKHLAKRAAEAREQAELEAEALELYKAHTGYTYAKSLSEAAAPERWLAVARKARELGGRAEK